MKYINEKVADKVEQFYKSGNSVATNFLDPSELVSVMHEVKFVEHCVWGGFEDAERKIIIVGEEMIDAEKQEFLTVIRVSGEMNFSHRSVLGSVLGLGIKREMIGDIVIKDNLCDIIVVKSIAEYIMNNLKFVGREKVQLSEVGVSELLVPMDVSKEVKTTVSSLRVDAVISAGFGISREKSADLIKAEGVKINHVLIKSAFKSVHEGDLISVRGKGRLEVVSVGGTSKSGRIKIILTRK
ncbi:MAG: hypothetical protein IJX99_09565 [Clostridia bacterium]|nr:hypothetical protein [Clostridia bacterium]